MNQKKNLLPIGFRDILTNEAELQFEYGQKLVKNFNSWGFQRHSNYCYTNVKSIWFSSIRYSR